MAMPRVFVAVVMAAVLAVTAVNGRTSDQQRTIQSKLQIELDEFYDKQVNIPTARMKAAQKIVAELEAKLKPKLKELLQERYYVTLAQTWEYTGSAYEDLKVCDPDEFDIMLPFDMTHHLNRPTRRYSVLTSATSSYCPPLTSAYNFLRSANSSSTFSRLHGGDHTLDSQKVMNGFHSVLQRAVNSVDFGDVTVWIGKDGPAMKVEAKYTDRDKRQNYLKIDLVPAVFDCDRFYVTKSDRYDTAEGASSKWRLSFSDSEKKTINKLTANKRDNKKKIYKMVKAFCKKDAPLARLDSYYLKNIFLHMATKYPGYWTDSGEYFIKFLEELLAFLKTGNLPMYFMPTHNLIGTFVKNNPGTVANIVNRLQRLLKRGDDELIKILQR